MMRLKQQSAEVYVADETFVRFSQEDIDFLKGLAAKSERRRVRVCAHRSSDETLHEMLLVFAKGTYIRPSMHIGKQESLHILEGVGTYIFFDARGKIRKSIPLGNDSPERSFYLRTPDSTYHSLIVESDLFVIHEITTGPFRREDTVFAEWAPVDGDPAVGPYMERLLIEAKALHA